MPELVATHVPLFSATSKREAIHYLVGVPVTFLEGAVLLCGDDAVTEETDAAGMEDDSTSTVLSVIHLSLAHTLTSQHHTVLIHHCAPTKIQQSRFATILRDSVS